MLSYLIVAMLVAAPAPKPPAEKPAPVNIEKILTAEKAPNNKDILVEVHIEYLGIKKKAAHVKFIDVRPAPAVNIDIWDPAIKKLKPGSILTVVGTLHFGKAPDVPRIRYKVREVSGKKYNDHRHWRTDQAIYILNPTYTVEEPKPKPEAKPSAKPEASGGPVATERAAGRLAWRGSHSR